MNIRFSAMRRIVPVLKKDDGFVLVTALLLLALLIMVGTTTLFQTSTEMKISSNYMTKRQSLFDADAGAQYIIKKLKQDIAAGTLSLTGNSIALNYARPNGFAFDPPATLNSLGGDRYSFQVTGHGDNNSLSAIEMVLQLQQSSGHFRYGVFGDQGMNFVGSRVLDSYNSNNGPYGIANSFSNCDIGTNSTQPQGGSNVNPIGIDIGSNVTIRGDGFCGPGGNPADVISVSGTLTGSRQAAPSAMDMTPVDAPTGGAWTDLGQVSLGSSDTLVLSSGNYYNSGTTATKKNFKMTGSATVIVSGDVVLKVANKFWMTGTSEILVTPGSSLTVYVEGNIDLSGSGIVNTSSIPANVQIYGGANTTDCDITGSVEFFGVVFAPNAQVRLTGTTDIYGSIVGRTVSMTGGGTLHYDEALANLGGSGSSGSITIVSWREI